MVGALDLDALLHTVAHVQWAAGNRDNADKVRLHVRTFMSSILKTSKCSHYIGFYQASGFENFRKGLEPRYKEHRVPAEAVVKWKDTIGEVLEEAFGIVPLKYIESDDAVSIIGKLVGAENVVIVSSDKDIATIAGTHYNPFKRSTKTLVIAPEDRWSIISAEEAQYNLAIQIITGDATDMPSDRFGLLGIGPAKAAKALTKAKAGLESYSGAILDFYIEKIGSAAQATIGRTFQMVRLLNGTPFDKYAGKNAIAEAQYIKENFSTLTKETQVLEATSLFDNPSAKNDVINLFK